MKTPTPKKWIGGSSFKCGRSKGSVCVTKGKIWYHISWHFQNLGGESVRDAATATARAFSFHKTSWAHMMKKYNLEIRDGCASLATRKYKGRPKQLNVFNAAIKAETAQIIENQIEENLAMLSLSLDFKLASSSCCCCQAKTLFFYCSPRTGKWYVLQKTG